jgi:molybdenum cofactor synthesis domain-containing protein
LTCKVEIICIGNELLIGKTLNTNAQWLSRRITSLGGKVVRVTTVGDNVDEISFAVKEALERGPHFIVTVGGMGPTHDDKTLEGVAKAFGSPLKLNAEALKLVREKYLQIFKCEKLELTRPRVKMAILPEGAKPVRNPVGTAPGIIIKRNSVTLVSLPGVPSEMQAIFDESIAELVKAKAGKVYFSEESMILSHILESELSPLIDKVMIDNPYVYVKSHPKGGEGKPEATIELHFSSTSENEDEAKSRVIKAMAQMKSLLAEEGLLTV